MIYNVWMAGYMIQGMNSPAKASFYGSMEADTFKEACYKLAQSKGEGGLYSSVTNSIWGCGLYDNESDARKSFG